MKMPDSTMRLITIAVSFVFLVSACNKAPKDEPNTTGDSRLSLTVYKSPTCGCCGKWAKHMEAAGFKLDTRNLQVLGAIKARYNLKPDVQSCHTAVSNEGNYVFEGHIPADIVRRFLQSPPEGAIGLTVPGMPAGSPGMEYGDQHAAYDVLMLLKNGGTAVYQHVDHPSR